MAEAPPAFIAWFHATACQGNAVLPMMMVMIGAPILRAKAYESINLQ